MIPAKSQMVDGSFGTLNTKRSFQIHMFLLHWTILFSGWMDLFAVTYYFLSTVTQKDLFPVYKKIFLMSHIYFCPLSHHQNYLSIGKGSFIVTYYFLSTVTYRKDLFKVTYLFFLPIVTGVSGVHIFKKILSIFQIPTNSALCQDLSYSFSQNNRGSQHFSHPLTTDYQSCKLHGYYRTKSQGVYLQKGS